MFRFFTEKKWALWAWLGSAIILGSLWVQVKIDVKINEWFGVFYDMIQQALATPNAITLQEYFASLLSFITLAGIYIALYVAISFFTAHFLFRWRTAMVEWYHSVYDKARKIEGAAQRVQEDTVKFSRIMESLGTSLIEAIMILIQFIPILFGLSLGIPIFFFGDFRDNVLRFLFVGVGGGNYSSRAALFFTGEYVSSFPFTFISPYMQFNTFPLWKELLLAPPFLSGAFHFPYGSVFTFVAELGFFPAIIIFVLFCQKLNSLSYINKGQMLFFVFFLLLSGMVDNYFEYYQSTFIFYYLSNKIAFND